MWVLTTFGFFSTVRKPGDDHLTVRARNAGDLDRLRDRYLPALGETIEGAGSDYRFRAAADAEEFAEAMAAVARDIDYANFKSEVNRRMGPRRSHVYGRVWSELHAIGDES